MPENRTRGRRSTALVIGVALVSAGIGGGVAIAMLGGTIGGVDLAPGVASGQATPCQTDPVNFEFVQPQWNGSERAFNVRQVGYQDLDPSCVSVGARLHIVVEEGNTTFLDTVVTPGATSGTVDLSMPLNANRAPRAEINYLVEG